jgi:phage tail-like protein
MTQSALTPLHVFRFGLEFSDVTLGGGGGGGGRVALGRGAFSECTGLEATMEPKVIKEGGWNYGAKQRAGPVTFATVILRRGLVVGKDLWTAFSLVAQGGYAKRLAVEIKLLDLQGSAIAQFNLERAMPVKIKFADLNAKNSEIGIEELHLAHEGLLRVEPSRGAPAAT